MFAGDGAFQAMGLVWCVIGVLTAIICIRNFMKKSRMIEILFTSLSVEGRERKRLYKITGYLFLYLTLISIFTGLSYLTSNSIFAELAVAEALSGVLIVIIRLVTGYKE